MSKEYVFWVRSIKRSPFYLDFFWNSQENLIKVIITESQIRSDGPLESDSQNNLLVNLSSIGHITWAASSPGTIGYIKIVIHESKCYYITPVNPFDPTLFLTHYNIDELISFCGIINALKANQIPDYDENPYIRQSKSEYTPSYFKSKNDFIWDKNISPIEYYYKFVPADIDKRKRLEIKIWKVIILTVLTIAVLGFLYALFLNFI